MPAHAHLTNGGVDFFCEEVDGALVIRYWGASITGDLSNFPFQRAVPHSDFDQVQVPGIMREHSRGWLGYPTISGHRNGMNWSTKFKVSSLTGNKTNFTAELVDDVAQLGLTISAHLDQFGVLRINYKLVNNGEDYCLNELLYWLPLPDRVTQTLDFAGRWSNERNPQRRDIQIGRWIRDSHEGRSGHNGTIGEIALTENTNFGTGEAWSVALAWSGDSQYCVERTYEGVQSLGAGSILAPGEVILKTSESYSAPELVAAFSSHGLDGLSAMHHASIRSRKNHPKSPRPLTLNMWEAIYFDHSFARVKSLVDVAAKIGVERVVLDDGWFGSRRNDQSGLGDWQVSDAVWPNGLSEISKYIADKGMQFGLWFEGEMVNPDSEIYRKHPDWILAESGRTPATWRHQLVLNIAHPDAFEYILESTSKVISDASVKYIKWDHNRTLIDAGHKGRAAYQKQTRAIYRLFDELRRRHPGLEIESCASGGGRIDLGMIDHADRFWTSDNNDALERQRIQRWTTQFIPPELLGTHIGPTPGHQTGRLLSLPFRAITALFGHSGIEWDISKLSEAELIQLANWIAYYKEKRSLIHTGAMIRMDYVDQNHHLYGVISEDQNSALIAFAQLEPITTSHPPALRIRGLKAAANYRVKIAEPAGATGMMQIKPPLWVKEGTVITGSSLANIGLPAPILRPAEALLIEIEAI
jgi:alpha-galactosidase